MCSVPVTACNPKGASHSFCQQRDGASWDAGFFCLGENWFQRLLLLLFLTFRSSPPPPPPPPVSVHRGQSGRRRWLSPRSISCSSSVQRLLTPYGYCSSLFLVVPVALRSRGLVVRSSPSLSPSRPLSLLPYCLAVQCSCLARPVSALLHQTTRARGKSNPSQLHSTYISKNRQIP
jgi:hypothetical protein